MAACYLDYLRLPSWSLFFVAKLNITKVKEDLHHVAFGFRQFMQVYI